MIKKVLSIGQNKAMNYLVRTVLSGLYQLVIVEDVFLGMHLLRQKLDINLVVIDIDYQTKESIDLILHINSSKIYNRPVIVLSSLENQQRYRSLMEARVYGHFVKPFNPIELVNSIDKLNIPSFLS